MRPSRPTLPRNHNSHHPGPRLFPSSPILGPKTDFLGLSNSAWKECSPGPHTAQSGSGTAHLLHRGLAAHSRGSNRSWGGGGWGPGRGPGMLMAGSTSFQLPGSVYPQEPFWPGETSPSSRGLEGGHLELPLGSLKWNLAPGYKWLGPSSRNQHHSPHSTGDIDITKKKGQLGREGGKAQIGSISALTTNPFNAPSMYGASSYPLWPSSHFWAFPWLWESEAQRKGSAPGVGT